MGPANDGAKETMTKVSYHAITGSVNYLWIWMTRRDMMVSSSVNNQSNSVWGHKSVDTVKQELRYATMKEVINNGASASQKHCQPQPRNGLSKCEYTQYIQSVRKPDVPKQDFSSSSTATCYATSHDYN